MTVVLSAWYWTQNNACEYVGKTNYLSKKQVSALQMEHSSKVMFVLTNRFTCVLCGQSTYSLNARFKTKCVIKMQRHNLVTQKRHRTIDFEITNKLLEQLPCWRKRREVDRKSVIYFFRLQNKEPFLHANLLFSIGLWRMINSRFLRRCYWTRLGSFWGNIGRVLYKPYHKIIINES